jgi:nucleoside-diphosphate-sugar epimerase
MKKAIVIGASGLAGSAFLRVMPKMGYQCVKVTRDNYNEMVGCKADVLINANGGSSKPKANSDPEGELQRTVLSTLKFCREFHFKTYVLLSTGDVYSIQDDPYKNTENTEIDPIAISPYGLFKYFSECEVKNQCKRWLILRLGGIIGPGLRKNPLYDLLTGDRIYVHPDSKFGYIHTDMVAEIVCRILEADIQNEIFNVCGSGLVSVRELMELTDNRDAAFDEALEPIHYELSHDKIDKIVKIPSSKRTVKEFIEWSRRTCRTTNLLS